MCKAATNLFFIELAIPMELFQICADLGKCRLISLLLKAGIYNIYEWRMFISYVFKVILYALDWAAVKILYGRKQKKKKPRLIKIFFIEQSNSNSS